MKIIEKMYIFVVISLVLLLIYHVVDNKEESIEDELLKENEASCKDYGVILSLPTIYSKGNGCFVMLEGGKVFPKDVYERLLGNTIMSYNMNSNNNLNKNECL